MNRQSFFTFIMSFFIVCSSFARLDIKLSTELNNKEFEIINHVIDELELILPLSIKNKITNINAIFEVKTFYQNDESGLPIVVKILQNSHSASSSIQISFHYIEILSKLPDFGKKNKVKEIFNYSKETPLLNKTVYDFVISKIIHEVGLLYEEKKELNERLSESPAFLNSAGFPERGFIFEKNTREKSNLLVSLSSEYDQLESPRESFASNLEYFLTDKNYRCRKAELYLLFTHYFSFFPFSEIDCKSTNKILLTPNVYSKAYSSVLKELDLKRLHSIHYLLAGVGKQIESRFGHSMLRLVFCSPKRLEINEKCLEDLNYHYVLSFRGIIEENGTSVINGLTGQYPMAPTIYPFLSIVDEYTKKEKRTIKSLPLRLTKSELSFLMNSILETHWSYEGRYKFFTNNCADEILQLLKRALPDKKGMQNIRISTPLELFNQLVKAGIGDALPLEGLPSQSSKYYYFESKNEQFDVAFGNLKKHKLISDAMSFAEYFKSKVRDRLLWVNCEKIKLMNIREQIEVFSSFLNKEEQILNKKSLFRFSHGIKLLQSHLSSKSELTDEELEYKNLLDQYTQSIPMLNKSPFYLLKSSNSKNENIYGLPLKDEVEALEKSLKSQNSEADDSNINHAKIKFQSLIIKLDKIIDQFIEPALLEEIRLSSELYRSLYLKFNQLIEVKI